MGPLGSCTGDHRHTFHRHSGVIPLAKEGLGQAKETREIIVVLTINKEELLEINSSAWRIKTQGPEDKPNKAFRKMPSIQGRKKKVFAATPVSRRAILLQFRTSFEH